jgi:hypothetical protein
MSDRVRALLASAEPERGLRAGFEEEGVPLDIDLAIGDASALASQAARDASLGVGIGADRDRLVLVLAAGSRAPYLEAPVAEARSFARAAARVVARRPS